MRTLTAAVVTGIVLVCGACHTGAGARGVPAQQGNVSLTAMVSRPGYGLSGPCNFTGTLVWQDDAWLLDGRFEFPTAGYEVGVPEVTIREIRPERVHILVPVTAPPPDALVAQVLTPVPVEAAIHVSREAAFSVEVSEPCP